MVNPWLTALKVIPWRDVIEHAPKVLKGARELLERQRQRRRPSAPAAAAPAERVVTPVPAADPALHALQQRLDSTQEEFARLQQTQEQMVQTLAELAEQNTRLVDTVERLRLRTRMLMAAVLVIVLAGLLSWALR